MAGIAVAGADAHTNFQTVRLGVGRHDGPGREVCVMELASMIAGERFSDRPLSVCPIIAAILRAYNDNLDDCRRGDLYRYAAEAIGTRGKFSSQLRRAAHLIEWAKARHDARPWCVLAVRGAVRVPEPDAGPDQIARYLISSLGRMRRGGGWSDETHRAVLELVDELIALGTADARELAGWPFEEIVEQISEAIEDRGRDVQLVA